jgi:penicillin-binding protein 1A
MKRKKLLSSAWRIARLAIAVLGAFALLLVGLVLWELRDLPRFDRLTDYAPKQATRLTTVDGQEVGAFYHERRTVVPMERIPKVLREAVVSAEDKDFYHRQGGISFSGMLRAAAKHFLLGGRLEGGSTITQQVVKTFLLSPERTFSRKWREIVLAERMDKHLSHDEILFLYLNQIYFGHQRYGVEEASRYYFGKHVWEINLGEAALLAGMPQSPQAYSPIHHADAAKRRQLYVLRRLREDGAISEQEEKVEAARPIAVNPPDEPPADYYLEEVRRYLEARYGATAVYEGGLQVGVGMDPQLQRAAVEAVEKGLQQLEKRQHFEQVKPEAAFAVIDPSSRRVLVLVGGRDFKRSSFDRAVQAHRQPGSAFKPFVYAAAIDSGKFTAASVLTDTPEVVRIPETGEVWKPVNHESAEFEGPMTLRRALAESKNTVAVKLIEGLGADPVIVLAHRLGIVSDLPKTLTLGLGAGEVTLLELTNAYATFDAGGNFAAPLLVLKVLDPRGQVLEANQARPQPALRPEVAYIMTDLLQSVITDDRGTGRRARSLPGPLAGKTGTPSDYRDAWFLGYSNALVAGAWVGFDDHRPLGTEETGARAALPIWMAFMEKALKLYPPQSFGVPPSVVFARVDQASGKLSAPGDLEGKQEPFLPGTAPTAVALPSGQAHQKDLFLREDRSL